MASTQDDVVVRLRLKDVKQFITDVKSGKLAIEDLEKQVKKAGQTAARESGSSGGFGKLASHFGFLKYAAVGAVGSLAAAAAGVAGYAVKSAASLEQVRVAFTTLLHSSGAANQLVSQLQKFATATPFELSGIEQSTQKLLSFGFSAKSIIPTLTAVGNAASGLNLGQGGMDEIITALGQMRMKGRVQGDELLQLAEHGVNAYAFLQRGLKLTPEQLQKAVKAGKISSATAIPIILKQMNAQFKGLMDKESHTLGGMWSNFHDAMQQGLVKLANPFMPTMKRWLGDVTGYLVGPGGKNGLFDRLGKFAPHLAGNITAGRAGFAAYNIGAILGTHGFDPAIEKGVRVVHNLGVIVKDVLVPALKDLSVVLAPVVLILENLDSITGFVADHSTAFRIAVDTLAGSILAYKLAVLGVNAGIWAYNFVTGIAEVKTVLFKDATNAQRLAIIAWKVAVWGATAAQWLWNIAMDANPIGLVVLAVAGLVAGFIIAYEKIKPFRDFINGLWDDLKGFWNWVTNVAGGFWNWVTGGSAAAPAPGTPAPSMGDPAGSAAVSGAVPGLASGGTLTQGGLTRVGERGPELLRLPRGSQVIPLPRVGGIASRGPIHVHVDLNGREIARAVYDDMDDRVARR